MKRTYPLRVRFIYTCMKICTRCGEEKSYSEFYKNSRMRDGYSSSCKKCANVATEDARKTNSPHYKKLRNDRRKRILDIVSRWKGSIGCQHCGESESVCLDLHHINPAQKDIHPSRLIGCKISSMVDEFSKCVVVCKNCHAKIHHNVITCPSTKIDYVILLEKELKKIIRTR